MRTFAIIGCLCILVVGGLIAVVMMDSEEEKSPITVTTPDERPAKPPPVERRYKPAERPHTKMPDAVREKKSSGEEVTEENVEEFGKEFHDKWYDDRDKLGKDRHKEMERLWFQGRRPRGDPDSIEKLEKLLAEYPETNRAGCAAFELGHHYIRNRKLDLAERRKKAEEYWLIAEDRYRDSLCEYNAHPGAMSKLALATWVYRKDDPGKARRLLEDILKNHEGETDHLGQPLSVAAKRLLDQLK
jgi:hypothetical protein